MIGQILGWKFNHAEGIETAGDEIMAWPDSLGSIPTKDQIAHWGVEYSLNQTATTLEAAIDRHLDAVANSYRYESIRTMVTYATSAHPTFGPEGRAAVKFRDAVYAYGIQVMADVQAGIRDIPTEQELLAGAPLISDFFE